MRWPWQKRAALPPFAVTSGTGGGAETLAGPFVTSDTALRHTTVWACVNLLADTISSFPVDVYRGDDEIATPAVLVEPAAGQPLHEWLYGAMTSLLLRGNFFAVVTARSGPGMLPSQLEPVHPDKVSVQVGEDGGIVYRVLGREIPREDVFHVRAYVMPGQVLGLSPIEYCRQTIGLGMATEEFGAKWFGDNATPSAVLSSKTLPKDVAQAFADDWRSTHKGKRKVAVLSGEAKLDLVTVAPNESQFVESLKLNVASVARIYRIPPEMLAGESGNSLTYANVEGRALDLLKFTISPWVVRLEAALSRLLPARQHVKFNVDALLRPTTKERYAAHKIALDAGFMTVNEARALEDLPPLPGGDTAAPSGNGQVSETATIA